MFDEKYDRVRKLGEGAFGVAHLVRERGSGAKDKKWAAHTFQRGSLSPGRLLVAKEIRTQHLSAKDQQGALAESELLRRMSHPNIIAYADSFIECGTLFILMEYADGGDLAEKITVRKDTECPFLESEVMFIYLQIALALNHVHGHRILHRDLKPLNVFLTQDGVVKLGDFGIARVLDGTTAGAQTRIGTPLYISPEMCNDEAYGVKSDLWSLGVLTYELACLRLPFQAANLPALVVKVCAAQPAPLPEGYSQELGHMIFSLLEKEPKKRPALQDLLRTQHARRHMACLRAHSIQRGSGGCEALVGPPGAGEQRRHRRPPAQVAGAADPTLRPSSALAGDEADTPPRAGHLAAAGVPQSGSRNSPEKSGEWHTAAKEEFVRNREIARRAKRRAESAHLEEHNLSYLREQEAAGAPPPARRAGRAESVPSQRRRLSSSFEEETDESWAAQVRKRGQQQKDEQHAAHLKQLEEARRQVHRDRQICKQRLKTELGLPADELPPAIPPVPAALAAGESTPVPEAPVSAPLAEPPTLLPTAHGRAPQSAHAAPRDLDMTLDPRGDLTVDPRGVCGARPAATAEVTPLAAGQAQANASMEGSEDVKILQDLLSAALGEGGEEGIDVVNLENDAPPVTPRKQPPPAVVLSEPGHAAAGAAPQAHIGAGGLLQVPAAPHSPMSSLAFTASPSSTMAVPTSDLAKSADLGLPLPSSQFWVPADAKSHTMKSWSLEVAGGEASFLQAAEEYSSYMVTPVSPGACGADEVSSSCGLMGLDDCAGGHTLSTLLGAQSTPSTTVDVVLHVESVTTLDAQLPETDVGLAAITPPDAPTGVGSEAHPPFPDVQAELVSKIHAPESGVMQAVPDATLERKPPKDLEEDAITESPRKSGGKARCCNLM